MKKDERNTTVIPPSNPEKRSPYQMDTFTFTVVFDYPMFQKTFRVCHTIDRHVFEEAFAPLPGERDLPPSFFPIQQRAQLQADEMRRKRETFARILASALASQIIEVVEKQDSQNGYYPGELPPDQKQ